MPKFTSQMAAVASGYLPNAYDPQKTLLIDDNHEVLECAERYGIRHLLAIHRPDSKGDEKSHDRYHLLKSFEEITL